MVYWRKRLHYYRIPIGFALVGSFFIGLPTGTHSVVEQPIEKIVEKTELREYNVFIPNESTDYIGFYLDKSDKVLSFTNIVEDRVNVSIQLTDPRGVSFASRDIDNTKNYTFPFKANYTGIHFFTFNTMESKENPHITVALKVTKEEKVQTEAISLTPFGKQLLELSNFVGGTIVGMGLPIFYERYKTTHKYK